MVDASLNFTSYLGLLVFLWAIFAGFVGLLKLKYALTHKKDAQISYMPKFTVVIQSFGRMIGLPIIAFINFFQGWRLDERIQFSVGLLIVGLLVESVPGVLSDFYRWQVRKGRNVPFAAITSEDKPSRITQSRSNHDN